jgi:hypothetical protein
MQRFLCIPRDTLEVRANRVTKASHGHLWLASKQLASELCLKSFDATGERWLGNAAASRGPCKIQLFAQHKKISDLLKVHHGHQ